MIYSLSMAARPGGLCLYLMGEIDLSVSGHLYEVLSDALNQTLGTVEVNLRGLQLLDCTGIGALLRARGDADRCGRSLFATEPQGLVQRVLRLTDTLTVLTAGRPVLAPHANARRVHHAAEASHLS
jgi:anti-anti-sigma factor